MSLIPSFGNKEGVTKISGGFGTCLNCEQRKEEINFWIKVKNGLPYFCDKVYIKIAGNKGFGVFARNNIKPNEVIEYCHSMVLSIHQKDQPDMKLRQYAYTARTGENLTDIMNIIPFGYGEIYNSSNSKEESNAKFRTYPEHNLIVFRATKHIPKDEEILVWWGKGYYDTWINKK